MSDLAIRARHVSKAYRLYDNPSDRLLDLIGLLPGSKKKVRHHLALQDASFDIMRGEKVAFIGRNGAGKSTLLKMITRVTEPTSGTLEVHGESRALLQIGTGFHPDFTGRENVGAYLASLGIGDKEAKTLIEDAVAFAELEDFASQPVKTYSTGMAMRLMFAASTMMKPDLLVIDEVLGVGDAYFQRKSFERIREMCEGRETTLLLVTHDIYSAASLCDRMIWIDRGRILIDADPPTVMRAYEDSMREQEERRLRAKALGYAGDRGEKTRRERVIVEIQSKDNQPPAAPVWFSRLALMLDGAPVASLRFGDDAFDDGHGGRLQREGSNWSDADYVDGRLARALKTHGSPFHKVAGVFEIDAFSELDPTSFAIAADYHSDAEADLRVSLTSASWRADLGMLPRAKAIWTSHVAAATPALQTASADTHSEEHDYTDWNTWTIVSDGAIINVEDGALELKWNGDPGPYLVMSPPINIGAGETLLLPMTALVASGRLGIGALNEAGQWVRTYEFEHARDAKTLEFTASEASGLKLVLYSAGPAPLVVRLSHEESAGADAAVNTRGVYGAGDIRMEGFRVYDADGQEALVLPLAKPARFEIDYRIIRAGLRERAQVLIAFKRNGVDDIYRVIADTLLFDAERAREGTLSLTLTPLPIAPGRYAVTVMIVAEGYFHEQQTAYFSINPRVYFAQAAAADIVVSGFSQLYEAAGVVGEGVWELRPASRTKELIS